MSIEIKCENLEKRYGKKVIIPNLSLKINRGEFFTLLGPSGCGKTTLLRMIAGFNTIENGSIYFDEKKINNVEPKDRNIGMVFQNYAIFPNLTTYKNIAFGLENRKLSKSIIDDKVNKILDLVKIANLKDSMPKNMSGGQQQRIALARAIVIEPDVLLMDEPLSNLDAKLRIDMRNIIKDIQRKVGITTVYVTHDQDEAMAVSDRIAVMNFGEIQQIGKPKNIYLRPSNIFVANFIGRTNIIEADLIENKYIKFNENYTVEMDNIREYKDGKVKVSVRPEEFIISDKNEGLEGIVKDTVFLGTYTHYIVEINDRTVDIIQESSLNDLIESGTKVHLEVKKGKINVFDYDTEKSIIKGVNDVEEV